MKDFFYHKRILLVEDDSDFQNVISDYLLRKNKFEIKLDVTDSCIDALLKIATCSGHYDLIIVDHRLKGKINGLYLYREVARKHPGIPVIMFSGISVAEFVDLTKRQRATPKFLSKPFSPREFDKVLTDLYIEKYEKFRMAG